MTLDELATEARGCKLCRLATTRKLVVFGEGNPKARLMFIGEGPGKDEDASGRPFVGRAGQLLTRIIENGLKLKREDVYIANVVKCRPTVDGLGQRDRPPASDEVAACAPYLRQQIALVSPEVIVTLGNPSTRFLLGTAEGITRLRGKWQSYNGIPVMPTYHPSFLLRNGGDAGNTPHKRDVWNDMKMVIEKLGLSR
ncbi:MAG TPA: uracil-DNA glycosylase [Turneriella sp.]|nr:uracil-DNA glycosylase [Turneriella sp.]HNA78506.1 uracil-DNA glycosylase [Turneriella sp.]HNL09558.1 uracil-DNA glycosylase [Turneriella sp.]HNL54924.1 uracil-DNA glycosylase [Turneriella sp.]HNM98914.1 uracil-DNA glycosylase [Turneriella sp.]